MAASNMDNPDMPVETKPLSELEEIQLSMNQQTDESLESTRRMLALAEESASKAISLYTSMHMEQLDRIDEGMDQINKDMKDAEKNLEGLEKCCGLCVLPWKRTKNFEKSGDYANAWNKNDDGQVNTNGPRVQVGDAMGMQGNIVTRITNDDRENEMENNLTEVNGMIGNLRNMAVDMGNEISSQNRTVDRINQKAEMLDDRVKVANKRTNQIMRNA